MIKRILSGFLFVALAFPVLAQPHKVTVNFDFGLSAITDEGSLCLDNLVTYLKVQKKPVDRIEIAGHCDSIGNIAFNENLANQRAEKVKNYLILKGVSTALLKNVSGFGKRLPLNDNADSIKRYLNRRVEVIVYFSNVSQAVKPVSTSPAAAPVATIDLSKMKADSTLVLKNINFYPNQHYPLSESYASIVALLHTLEQNPVLKIQIRGFVCCLPYSQFDGMDQDTYTPDLSTQRAKYIYGYLVHHGIDSTRLSYQGFGGRHPLVEEITDDDRTTNRRVEIKILSK